MAYPEESQIRWQPYNENSFQTAKEQRKPIFMLISAAWCHWCHVYERDTLEAAIVVRNMNRYFVPIFVDADKRQDLTRKYLAGGWPTTALFSLKGEKVASFSGHMNKDALLSLMEKVASGKLEPEEEVEREEEEIRPAQLSKENIRQFFNDLNSQIAFFFDDLYGGFGKGQKFPMAAVLDYLIDEHALSKKNLWKGMAERTLKGMERLMDKEEGGFFRYATQRDWGEPHYEKMLKENAEISEVYLKAGKAFQNEEFLGIATRNYGFLEKNLLDPREGGFFGSQDADENYYRLAVEDRKRLKPPSVDKTKYCEWNAVACISYLHAHKLLAKLEFWGIADGILDLISKRMISPDGALHYFEGKEGAKLDGLLMDNAWAALAFLEAYKVGKQQAHLEAGKKLLEYLIANFYSQEKNAFMERNSRSTDMYRSEELKSGRTPYHENAVACLALLEGYAIMKDERYLEIAKKVLANFLYVHDKLEDSALIAKAARALLKSL